MIGLVFVISFWLTIGIAVRSFLIALAWNWLGVHALFDAPLLDFWQVVGVAVLTLILTWTFRGLTVVRQS